MITLKNMYKSAGLIDPSKESIDIKKIEKESKESVFKIQLNKNDTFIFNLDMWQNFQNNLETSEFDDINENFSFENIIESEIIYSSKIEGVHLAKEDLKSEFDSTEEKEIKIDEAEFIKDTQKKAFAYLLNQEKINHEVLENVINILSSIPGLSREETTGSAKNKYRNDKVGIFKNINGIDEEIHSGTKAELIEESMDSFFSIANEYAQERKDHPLSIVTKASIIHTLFEYIHPYFDGNGRVGRMIVSWYLRRTIYENTSYYLSEIIHHNKNKYYKSLEHSQKTKLLNYHGIFMFEVMDKSIRMHSELSDISSEVKEKIKKPLFDFLKKLLILDVDCREINYSEVKQYFKNHSRQTFYNNIDKLISMGILKQSNEKGVKKFILNKKYKSVNVREK